MLLQLGSQPGLGPADPADPTLVQDVFFRIGGAAPGQATTSLLVNSSQVILDDIWAWRADHGNGVGWTDNAGDTGVVVNGDHVTAYGLFVEHYQKYEVIWNGKAARTSSSRTRCLRRTEEAAWMANPAIDGYPAFLITHRAAGFHGYGMGSYSFFDRGVPVFAASAFETASPPGSELHDLLTIFLSAAGSGGIESRGERHGQVVDGREPRHLSGCGPLSVMRWPSPCRDLLIRLRPRAHAVRRLGARAIGLLSFQLLCLRSSRLALKSAPGVFQHPRGAPTIHRPLRSNPAMIPTSLTEVGAAPAQSPGCGCRSPQVVTRWLNSASVPAA